MLIQISSIEVQAADPPDRVLPIRPADLPQERVCQMNLAGFDEEFSLNPLAELPANGLVFDFRYYLLHPLPYILTDSTAEVPDPVNEETG